MDEANQINNDMKPKDRTFNFTDTAVKAIKYFTVFMIKLGAGITSLVFKISRKILKCLNTVLVALKNILQNPAHKFINLVSSLFLGIPTYFKNLFTSAVEFKNKALSISNKYGKGDALKFVTSSAGKKVWSYRGAVTTVFNWAAPVLSVGFLISVITYAQTLDYGIGVECNGENLGIVSEEGAYDEAEKVMQQRITYVEGNETVTITPKLSVKVVKDTTEIINPNQLADKMLVNTDSELTKASGLYIDGQFLGAVEDKDTITGTLSSLLSEYNTADVKSVEFAKDVEYKDGLYLKTSIVEENQIVNLINSDTQVQESYEVQDGDSPSLIADKNNVSLAELLQLNPSLESNCKIGDEIILAKRQPYMPVKVVKQLEYTDKIKYDTIKIEDNSQYQNIESVLVKGEDGQRNVKAEVVYVDGYEVDRNILSENITKQPVTQKVSVGTKVPKPSRSGQSSGNTIYTWPLAGGYISSHFGDRDGRSKPHYALDIVAPNGTAIFAAESGTVVMSRWYYGYGNCTQIQHDDGNVTLYGHQSKILVTEGQYVERGELIGLVGNTGDSYGNHLHFEVKKNGVKYDPSKFVC